MLIQIESIDNSLRSISINHMPGTAPLRRLKLLRKAQLMGPAGQPTCPAWLFKILYQWTINGKIITINEFFFDIYNNSTFISIDRGLKWDIFIHFSTAIVYRRVDDGSGGCWSLDSSTLGQVVKGNVMALNLIPIDIFVIGYIQPTPHPVSGCVKNHSNLNVIDLSGDSFFYLRNLPGELLIHELDPQEMQ